MCVWGLRTDVLPKVDESGSVPSVTLTELSNASSPFEVARPKGQACGFVGRVCGVGASFEHKFRLPVTGHYWITALGVAGPDSGRLCLWLDGKSITGGYLSSEDWTAAVDRESAARAGHRSAADSR